jgi:hypothetical protein
MKKLLQLCAIVVLLSAVMAVKGDVLPDGLAFYQQGSVALSSPGDYSWWYGCSPTSAGMIMGHYDVCGYNGGSYGNLVKGGNAENSTYGDGSYLANDAIASSGHIHDFYSGGYNATGDDISPPTHSFDCLADFMGTSQDGLGGGGGWTTFYYWTNGKAFTAADAFNNGVSNKDGMYGIGEYLRYAGYDAATLYTQLIYSANAPLGFTFEQYKAEIDAGRPVIIQVDGHSMYGYGYSNTATTAPTILLHDTWSEGEHSMVWGGSYSGMQQWGVVCVTPIPEPATMSLLSLGALSLLRRKK